MSIRFACEICRRVYELPGEAAGRQAKCECGQMLLVPAASTYTGRTRPHNEPPESPVSPPPVESSSTPPSLPEEDTPPDANVPPPLPEEAFEIPPTAKDHAAAITEPANEPPPRSLDPPGGVSLMGRSPSHLTPGRRNERLMSFSEVLLAFFDLRLRSYLTPYLLRVFWAVTLVTAACFFAISACLIAFEVSLFEVLLGRPNFSLGLGPSGLGLPQPSRADGGLPPSVRELLVKVIRLGSLTYCCVVALIAVRVALELGIVVFRMADALERIRARLLREES